MLALRPGEYWLYTPAELSELLVGANKRNEEEWERAALVARTITNMAGKISKKTVTIDDVLCRKPQQRIIDPELKFDELWRRVEQQRVRRVNGD